MRDRGRNGFPIVGIERAQIDHLDARLRARARLLRRLKRPWHHRAVGDDRDVVARTHNLGFAERNHVIRPGIRRAAEGLAIEPLVLEKQHRIVAADRGAQQAVGVESVGWENHADAGSVGEDALAALRVVDRAAGEIAADGDADHGRREKPLFERQRISGSSLRSWCIAGQM